MSPTTLSPEPDAGRWKETTFVFGGTFDPPHLGHREVVLDLARRLRPKSILILPAGNPPLKTATTDARHRLAMVRLAFEFSPEETPDCPVTVDDREITQPGRSYTIQTLEALSRESARPIAFVCGTDQFYQMERWHRFPELLALADWLFLLRRPEPLDRARAEMERWVQRRYVSPEGDHWTVPGTDRTVHLIPTPAREISSSEIRADLASGRPPRTVSADVAHYIEQNRLYIGDGTLEPIS